MKISACMIVRDEEDMIGRCLGSLAGVADEIIVVDTGSTDRTVEIASFFGAKIYHEKWRDDFSFHRNSSIKRAKGDWILIIDADEEIENREGIRKFVESCKADCLKFAIINKYKNGGETGLTSTRMFKRCLGLKYFGIVHNQLSTLPGLKYEQTHFNILHYGYDLSPEKQEIKKDRTKHLLELQIAENPENALALWNYATMFASKEDRFNVEKAPLIADHCERAMEITDPARQPHFLVYLQSMVLAGWTRLHLGEFRLAVDYAQRAIMLADLYLDALFLAAHAYQELKEYELSTDYFNSYLRANDKYDPSRTNVIMNYIDRKAESFNALGYNALKLGRMDEAFVNLYSSLKHNPDFTTAFEKLSKMNEDGHLTPTEWEKVLTVYNKTEAIPA